MKNVSIFWFRNDLRLKHNPGLMEAIANHDKVIPVYIYSEDHCKDWPMGGASKWWLHHSLTALNGQLKNFGSKLHILKGDPIEILKKLVKDLNAQGLYWNRNYDPISLARDKKIKAHFAKTDLINLTFNSNMILEPWDNLKSDNTPYKVFTAYWNNLIKNEIPQISNTRIDSTKLATAQINSLQVNDLHLLPSLEWDKQFYEIWKPGEETAHKRVSQFLKSHLESYNDLRNFPAKSATSLLSPHLHFGEVSPLYIWNTIVKKHGPVQQMPDKNIIQFLKELVWREFAINLLYHFPTALNEPIESKFESFPWKANKKWLTAWQKGQTGVPIVDAGMRELWTTGWMHNRVRMIVASFLVKNLLIPWQQGAQWFWDTLVDADLANNSIGWQWVAGCGADAAPFFRIFNPELQAQKFDPQGEYIKKWVPELKKLNPKYLYAPWKADMLELSQAGITLGKDYPLPLIDLKKSRDEALEAYKKMK